MHSFIKNSGDRNEWMNGLFRFLIGKGGSRVKKYKEQNDVRVMFPRQDDTDKVGGYFVSQIGKALEKVFSFSFLDLFIQQSFNCSSLSDISKSDYLCPWIFVPYSLCFLKLEMIFAKKKKSLLQVSGDDPPAGQEGWSAESEEGAGGFDQAAERDDRNQDRGGSQVLQALPAERRCAHQRDTGAEWRRPDIVPC